MLKEAMNARDANVRYAVRCLAQIAAAQFGLARGALVRSSGGDNADALAPGRGSISRISRQQHNRVRCLVPNGAGKCGENRGRLLFSNPATARGPRRRITIKASIDGGESWASGRSVLLDEGASAGYSCLTMIDEETVGILYEGSRAHMTFQRILLSELFDE